MNRKKFYLYTTIALLISNLVLVGMMVMHEPPNKLGPRKIIIEKLAFDEAQQESFLALIEIHRSEIETVEDELLSTQRMLFLQLNESQNEALNDSLKSRIGTLETEVQTIHYQHFLALKALCTDEQAVRFEALAKELADLFNYRSNR